MVITVNIYIFMFMEKEGQWRQTFEYLKNTGIEYSNANVFHNWLRELKSWKISHQGNMFYKIKLLRSDLQKD